MARRAKVGTVISGTLRNVDLIPAFLEELHAVHSAAWEQLQMQPHPLPPSYALEDEKDGWWQSEQADWFLQELFDALDQCAPEGHYFGAHYGDGSDFGFWPQEDYEGNGRYWTVVIPHSERRTKWHPTEKTGAFSVLSRGAFATESEAHAWAKKNLAGEPYSVRAEHAPNAAHRDRPPANRLDKAQIHTALTLVHAWEQKMGRERAFAEAVRAQNLSTQEQGVLRRSLNLAPNAAPPPPPRRGKLDTQRRLARVTSEHTRREKPFDPAAPREHYAKPHHFAVNVRGGGRKDPSWSPEEELWRRRELILPIEADTDAPFPLEGGVVGALYQWHGGQGSMVYSLASTGDHDLVSRSMIRAAADELKRELPRTSGEDREHLEALIDELEMILYYPEGASASGSGMDIDEYEYDTWSEWPGKLEENQSRSHLRPQKTFFFISGDIPGNYSKPYTSYIEAVHAKESLSGSWQGDGVILEVQGADLADARQRASSVQRGYLDMAPNASSRARTRAALAGEPDPDIDEHAANELELYLDNDRRFSPKSPEGQGRAIAQNLLKKIKKGNYDHQLAVKGWMYVVESAAKSYAQEFGERNTPWHKMFNIATRRATAQSLADSFKREVDNGEWG